MTAKKLSFLVAGVVAGVALTVVLRAQADKGPPSACAQWQVAIATTSEAQRLDKLPEPGALMPVNAPAGGWEPFAVGPNGVVYYRRCSP